MYLGELERTCRLSGELVRRVAFLEAGVVSGPRRAARLQRVGASFKVPWVGQSGDSSPGFLGLEAVGVHHGHSLSAFALRLNPTWHLLLLRKLTVAGQSIQGKCSRNVTVSEVVLLMAFLPAPSCCHCAPSPPAFTFCRRFRGMQRTVGKNSASGSEPITCLLGASGQVTWKSEF